MCLRSKYLYSLHTLILELVHLLTNPDYQKRLVYGPTIKKQEHKSCESPQVFHVAKNHQNNPSSRRGNLIMGQLKILKGWDSFGCYGQGCHNFHIVSLDPCILHVKGSYSSLVFLVAS